MERRYLYTHDFATVAYKLIFFVVVATVEWMRIRPEDRRFLVGTYIYGNADSVSNGNGT